MNHVVGRLCWERATPVALMGCVIHEGRCATKRGGYSACSGALPAMSGSAAVPKSYAARASSVSLARGGTPMAARSMTALTSALRRMRL